MKKKMMLAILAFYVTVHLQAQNGMVPDGWYVRAKACDKCVLGLTERVAGRTAASAVAVYTSKGKQSTELLSIKSGDKRCSGVAMQETKYDTTQGCRAIQSSVVMLPESKSLLSVEGSDSADIQEMMLYKRRLSDLERQKAETYLAIKHDITISEYVSEAGDTLWDNGDGQTRRIFGMAHDSTLGLYKTVCGDVEGLTIEVADSLKAGDYLLCGERSGLPGGRVWRIEREGLAGETVIVKVGRNRQWREQEPVAILTEERNGITTETQLEAADKDESHYYFSVRFGEGKRSTYEFSLSARDTQSNPSADTPREKSHKSGEGTSPATASDTGGTVELYPNPASDFVVIKGLEGEKKEVEVINAVGLTCKKAGLGENEQSVDIHTLMSGNYIVVVRGGDNEYRVKLIKK